jgi:ABC-2 type transport system ATP-binding protein
MVIIMTSKNIEVENLTKVFGNEVAVKDVDFDVSEGEVLGFVGPNGAGKSTTINAMLGFMTPTGGEVKMFDMDIRENPRDVKSRIGVVPEDYELYDERTGIEHINMSVRAMGADVEPSEIINKVGLTEDEAKRKISGYSTGMQQRLVLGMALVGNPDVLILDEPGNGLDPNGIIKLQEIINELSDNDVSVFFSSHILSNIETVCDRLVVLNNGSVEFQGTIEDLRREVGQRKEITIEYSGDNTDSVDFDSVDGIVEYDIYDNNEIEIIYERQKTVEKILREAIESDITIESITTEERSLSELFGEITTRGDTQ